ncbi:hypothetical protein [Aureibacillus halotolerans]|uniref:Uncharacterized protein n=1 Tax=Aureibacillus halotolerans TaxID=1508390 RepID=A0A4R6TVW2_9BACI|nr:hypothetical protein [Aureibacillus halotolerans]TDQ35406.1 hypothetical protein EV213_12123 [Aureibacillus halotolerans]
MPKGRKDSSFEGREKVEVDVDRMLSEGMGASTLGEGPTNQVDEARDLPKEEPPFHTKR